MSEFAPFLRGAGSNLAGMVGWPVDAATDVVNLLRAGVGYAGHKTGLLKEPLELIDKRNAIGSTEWFKKGTPLAKKAGESEAAYTMGELAPLAVAAPTMIGQLLRGSGGASKYVGPGKRQAGALYPGGSDDVLLTWQTSGHKKGQRQMDISDEFDPVVIGARREIPNISLGITHRNKPDATSKNFGEGTFLANPDKFEPRQSGTVLTPQDQYTLTARSTGDMSYAPERLRSRDMGQILPNEGKMLQGIPPSMKKQLMSKDPAERAKGAQNVEVWLSNYGAALDTPEAVFKRLSIGGPRFDTFEQFMSSPKGGQRLTQPGSAKAGTEAISDMASELRQKLSIPAVDDIRLLQKPETWANSFKRDSSSRTGATGLSPKEQEQAAELFREGIRDVRTGPSGYAELKKYGPTQLNAENFPYFYSPTAPNPEYAQSLRDRGIKLLTPEDLGVDPALARKPEGRQAVHDALAKLQTTLLRGTK
ncbi:MAG: hypothetical protein E6Q97_17925 [Desulfurellales bacterium]|nr:MAG: hypothetical protein E6Q97_17925 [Desulfurellales bacterium]